MGRIRVGLILYAVLLLLVTSWSLPAWSQVEEIVVTVRKKAENLQDVPMSISAIGAADIQRKGIKDITDVAQFSTSLQFDESFAQSDTRIAVRGLSPTRGRQNVALLVDGIDVSSEAITSSGGSLLLNTRLVDVERIDVVLGPQMSLYGRSAFAGALQYITKDASEEFEADLSIDVGRSDNFDANRYEAIAGISGPILGEKLGYRLNGAWWEDEGFYRNTITGAKIGGESGYGLALTLNSDVTEQLSFKFRAEYTDDESEPSAQVFLPFNAELDVPQGAFDAGVAECYPDFVNFVNSNPANLPDYQNNQNYLNRAMQLLDPAYFAQAYPQYLVPGYDANSDPNFVIPAGGGPYCEEKTPARIGTAPDRDSLLAQRGVTLAPNPDTPGVDYEGFDREMYRLSLVSNYDADAFTWKVLTGFTRDDNTETQDTNVFAFPSMDAGPYLDGNVNSFSFDNEKVTKQFSLDTYITTELDGPVNGLIGALYWHEDVNNSSSSITGQGSGSHCFWNSQNEQLFDIDNACTGYTGTPIAPYQNAAKPFRTVSPADRDTEHMSIYGAIDFDFAENWTLAFEGRYNEEDIEVKGPIFFDPGASGGPGGLNPCGIFFRPCEPFDDWRAGGNWFSDSFFPWTDEAIDGTDLNGFVPIPDLVGPENIARLEDMCDQFDAAAFQRSVTHGPVVIEREADGVTPAWEDGDVVPVLDENGQAVLTQGATDTFNPWCVSSLQDNDKWFSPKVRLEWTPGDDLLLYISWARARKPGGFSLLTVGSAGLDRELAEFDPEKMEVWEFGGNSTWFDNTIVLNGSVFYQDFTDKQALTSTLGNDGRLISKIENAGAAEVWGTELNLTWSPIAEFIGGNWQVNLGGTWLPKREYTDFVVDSTSPTTAANAGNCTQNGDLCSVSYTGNKLENSAALSINGFLSYTLPLTASLDTYIETDAFWLSKRYVGITNSLAVDDYLQMNLRWGFTSDRWDFVMYVDNLLDDGTVRSAGGGPGLGCCFILGSGLDSAADALEQQGLETEPRSAVMVDLPLYNTAFLPDPRVVGARLAYRFGRD